MSTFDIILKLLEEQNKKQKELTDFLGISKNQFTDWKSGRIKSYNKHLDKIAAFFDVSVDYLITGREIQQTENSDLAKLYNQLDDTDKNEVKDFIKYLLSKEKYNQEVGKLA